MNRVQQKMSIEEKVFKKRAIFEAITLVVMSSIVLWILSITGKLGGNVISAISVVDFGVACAIYLHCEWQIEMLKRDR